MASIVPAGLHARLHGSRRRLPGAVRAAVAVLVALVAGCASAPKPTQIDGRIDAAANVNPSVSKRPSPILLRVYELKSVTSFNAADFMSLYQRDQAELAADLIARDDVSLQPGESHPLVKTLAPETRFIGVVACYRDLEHAIWRASVAVQTGKKQQVTVHADELAVKVTVAP